MTKNFAEHRRKVNRNVLLTFNISHFYFKLYFETCVFKTYLFVGFK